MGKIKYAMKKSLNIKNEYLIVIGVMSVFLIVGSFSYALFTTQTESKGTLNIAAGTLYSSIESEQLNKDHSITLNGGESKNVTITLKNTNSIAAKFNLWYEKVEGVSVSYDSSKDTPPTKEGVALEADNKKVYQLKITNTTNDSKTITFGSDAGLSNKPLSFPEGKITVEGENLITVLKKKINDTTKVYDEATEAEQKEMFTFTHEAGTQQEGWSAEELTDYRYIGTNPNNYVTFNDETWRIIGVFTVEDENGKKEQRVKLIRNEAVGNYSFDNKPSGEGSSDSEYGSSDWTDSRLKDVLNSGLYYNRQRGNCPYGQNNGITSCDFTMTGLTVDAKNMIGKTKWYLGGNSNVSSSNTSQSYEYERGDTVAKTKRETNWIGEVGLMYPSDYGYAASGNSCLSSALNAYGSNCASTDWLYDSTRSQWTITPYADNSYDIWIISGSTGYIDHFTPRNCLGVRPSIYLKSNVEIISGNGSSEHPYVLTME